MRTQVPQFIEVEDKIFGPLTFKQFLYLAGAGGLSFVLYIFLPLILAVPLIAAIVAFAAALAFYKVNNKPFVFVVESWIKFTIGKKLYVWRKKQKQPKASARSDSLEEKPNLYVPKLSDSRLKDLAWNLDVENHEEMETNKQNQ